MSRRARCLLETAPRSQAEGSDSPPLRHTLLSQRVIVCGWKRARRAGAAAVRSPGPDPGADPPVWRAPARADLRRRALLKRPVGPALHQTYHRNYSTRALILARGQRSTGRFPGDTSACFQVPLTPGSGRNVALVLLRENPSGVLTASEMNHVNERASGRE